VLYKVNAPLFSDQVKIIITDKTILQVVDNRKILSNWMDAIKKLKQISQKIDNLPKIDR
jgi:hypothetical protein